MIRNYFKIAWRTLTKHRAYSAINIAGLSVGMAACLLIFVVIRYETSFDTFRPNFKNIYHIVTEQKRDDGFAYNPGVPVPATEALRLDFPEAKFAALESNYGSQFTVIENKGYAEKKFTEQTGVVFIEPQFFEIFKTNWLTGDASALKEPNMVVLSKGQATKYFGDWRNVEGKLLKMDNLVNLKVAGVIEDPRPNTDFPFTIMVSFVTWKQHPVDYNYANNWNTLGSSHQVFALFPPGDSPARISNQLKNFYNKHSGNKINGQQTQVLQPLADLHFDTRFGNSLGDHITNRATLKTLTFIAILIIVMASINFINLSTAQSVGRSKEVGIRKVLGSSRGQLVAQVFGETALIVFFSMLLALVLARFGIPYLKNVASIADDINLFTTGNILFLALAALVVILLSGFYPALVVSGFKPVLAIKNKITAASVGGIPLRRMLVVAQFAISQLLIIGTIIAVKQMNFVNSADLGFDKNAVLIIPGYTDSLSLQRMDSYKQQLLRNPDVKSVTFTADPPSSDNNWATNFYFDHSNRENGLTTFLKMGDADYFKTFGMRFVAGGGFEPSDTASRAVVNETFLHKLGIQNPQQAIGKTVKLGSGRWLPITGVVEDFKTNSLRDAVKPIVITSNKKFEGEVAIKISTRNIVKTVAGLQQQWEKVYPEYAYNGYFLDDNIAKFYQQENQLALVYKAFALIAIFISCLGLYGLVSFMTVQRVKEVGIRKVLGASVSSIIMLFSKEFMLLIGLSFIIAIPVAWYMMNQWLQNFAYRISVSADVFVLAIALSLILAWVTVGYRAVKAALANPVRSLRSE